MWWVAAAVAAGIWLTWILRRRNRRQHYVSAEWLAAHDCVRETFEGVCIAWPVNKVADENSAVNRFLLRQPAHPAWSREAQARPTLAFLARAVRSGGRRS